MEPFVIYLIKVNGLLIFFWIFYKLFLQKETFYTFNRFYFLSAVLIAFVLPLLSITKIEEIVIPASNFQTISTTAQLNKNVETKEMNVFENINWLFIILSIVGFISMIKIGIRIYKIFQLVQSIKKLEKNPTENIRITSDENMVYSFYKWIVISNSYLKHKNYSVLIQHEKIHLKQKHTFDLLIFGFLQDLFWFNLIIQKMQKDVNLNLEYIVDAEITKQKNSYQYQKALLNYKQEIITPILTNAFNTSDLKKRILMLNAKKSNPMKKLKIALAAPALLAFFGLFQIETIAQVKTEKIKNNDKKESSLISKKPLYLVDGKEMNEAEFRKISPDVIKSIKVVNEGELIEKYGAKAKDGILLVSTLKNESINKNKKTTQASKNNNTPLYFVDDKEISEAEFRKISPNVIQSIKVVNEGELVEKYGAKNGIILITTNKKTQINDTTEKDIETVTSIFNDLKRDIKKLEDDDFKITKISSSITQADGTKITVSENY